MCLLIRHFSRKPVLVFIFFKIIFIYYFFLIKKYFFNNFFLLPNLDFSSAALCCSFMSCHQLPRRGDQNLPLQFLSSESCGEQWSPVLQIRLANSLTSYPQPFLIEHTLQLFYVVSCPCLDSFKYIFTSFSYREARKWTQIQAETTLWLNIMETLLSSWLCNI